MTSAPRPGSVKMRAPAASVEPPGRPSPGPSASSRATGSKRCPVMAGKCNSGRRSEATDPLSSGAILAVAPGLPRGDHFLEQDAPDDRRGEDVAARVRREPARPFEQIERLLHR